MNIRNIKMLIVFSLLICGVLVTTDIEAKKPVGDKPDKTKTELIIFTGDLDGIASVADCCPNAGPFPEYTMTLNFDVGDYPAGTYDGLLFINYYGVGRNREYIVQFWTDDFGIEIIGGLINYNKKTKLLTVTFENAECKDLDSGVTIELVSFVLERAPD